MKRVAFAVLLLSMCAAAARAQESPCPKQASGNAKFVIVDDDGAPVAGSKLLFTASNWDSTISHSSDATGEIFIPCVPAGGGYDVTVTNSGYAATHVTASAEESPATRTIRLRPPLGPYVVVFYEGGALPGAAVEIRNSDGEVEKLTTDDSGRARFRVLRGNGPAVMTVSMAGFVTQRARIDAAQKNAGIVFDISSAPTCPPVRIVTSPQ